MSEESNRIRISLPSKIISFLAKDDLTLQLVFLKQNGEEYKPSYISTDTATAEQIRITCQKFIKKRERWGSFNYTEQPDNEISNGVFRIIDVNSIPNKGNILKKPTELEEHISKDLMEKTKWMGFRFESSDRKSVFLLKKIASTYFILNEHKKFHFVRGGIATVFDANLVKFPGDFDMIKYEDDMMIFNPYQFEELFKYHIFHEQDRKEVFDYLRNNADYQIHDLDDLESLIINNRYLLRKFGPIKEKEIYKQKFDTIKEVLAIRTVKTMKIEGNIMKFKGSRALVNFFNDDYLSSHFTNRNYTSHSKTEE